MAEKIFRQVNFTGGELDPLVQRRRDIKAYLASSAALSNVLIYPQGPIARRPGLAYVDKIRSPLQAVSLAGATITAPNGGDTTKLAAVGDGALETTTAMGVTDPFVVAEIDFAAPVTVGMVDLIDYFADGGSGSFKGGGGTGFGDSGGGGLSVLP